MEKPIKDDILAFLDSKFANLDAKRDKKKKKKKVKEAHAEPKDPKAKPTHPVNTPILDAIAKSEKAHLTSENVYAALATDAELQKLGSNKQNDSLGVNAMKEFHLKKPACYDRDLKDKVFFIA